MNIVITILGAIFAIFCVVIIHELGHFIVARSVGIRVLRFAIGFGKPIWSITSKKGAEFAVGWLPIGGYVRMLGEGDTTPLEEALLPKESLKALSYHNKNVFQRMAVVLAGPLMNFILAIILYWALFLPGVVYVKPIIGAVKTSSIAARAGLKPMDQIIAVNHQSVKNWRGVIMQLIANMGNQHLVFTVIHRPTAIQREVTLPIENWRVDARKPAFLKTLGISPYQPKSSKWPPSMLEIKKYSVLTAWKPALEQTAALIKFNAIVLGKMITGKMSTHSLGGPISIFQMAGQASRQSYRIYLGFLAFLSVALGFINLLPIPGLDGGHFFFQLIELVGRRPVPMRIQALSLRIGLILLILLILHATLNDMVRLLG